MENGSEIGHLDPEGVVRGFEGGKITALSEISGIFPDGTVIVVGTEEGIITLFDYSQELSANDSVYRDERERQISSIKNFDKRLFIQIRLLGVKVFKANFTIDEHVFRDKIFKEGKDWTELFIEETTITTPELTTFCNIDGNGIFLAVPQSNNELKVWTILSNEEPVHWISQSIALSNDSMPMVLSCVQSDIVVGGVDGTVSVFRMNAQAKQFDLYKKENIFNGEPVFAMIESNGRIVVGSVAKHPIVTLDSNLSSNRQTLETPKANCCSLAASSSDDRDPLYRIAAGFTNGTIRVYSSNTRKLLADIRNPTVNYSIESAKAWILPVFGHKLCTSYSDSDLYFYPLINQR